MTKMVLTKEYARRYYGTGGLNEFQEVELGAIKYILKRGRPLSLDGLTHLSDSLAHELSFARDFLSLCGLTELAPSTARALICKRAPGGWIPPFDLHLGGLTDISPELANALSGHTGGLYLRGIKSLTKEAASFLAKNRWMLALNGLEELTEDAAAELGRHKGQLSLKSLRICSENVLLNLARNSGQLTVNLSGLNGISDLAANALICRDQSAFLEIEGLNVLSDSASVILSQCKSSLSLYGDFDISDYAAKHLASHHHLSVPNHLHDRVNSFKTITCSVAEKFLRGDIENFRLFRQIDLDAAILLASHKGDLILEDLPNLPLDIAEALASAPGLLSISIYDDADDLYSSEVAGALAKHGGELELKNVKGLNLAAAQALAKHKGSLSIDINRMSVDVASALAQHDGDLTIGLSNPLDDIALALAKHQGSLTLRNVYTLSVESARAFATRTEGITILSLNSLSIANARALARCAGYLTLDITELSDKAAFELAKHKNCLDLFALNSISVKTANILSASEMLMLGLGGLENMPTDLAETLSSFNGYLFLSGLPDLSIGSAKALSKINGALCLDGLQQIDDSVARALSTIQGKLELNGLLKVSPTSAKALAKIKELVVSKEIERVIDAYR